MTDHQPDPAPPGADTEPAAGLRPRAERPMFSAWLAQHVRGTLDTELTLQLDELVAAVTHYAKGGTLTLKLKVAPAGSGSRSVTITGDVDIKPPEPDPEVGFWYVGPDGGLFRDDPLANRLPGVPFRDHDGIVKRVDPGTGEVRRVDDPGDDPRPIPDQE